MTLAKKSMTQRPLQRQATKNFFDGNVNALPVVRLRFHRLSQWDIKSEDQQIDFQEMCGDRLLTIAAVARATTIARPLNRQWETALTQAVSHNLVFWAQQIKLHAHANGKGTENKSSSGDQDGGRSSAVSKPFSNCHHGNNINKRPHWRQFESIESALQKSFWFHKLST